MKKFTLSIVTAAMISTTAMADISSKSFGGEAKLFYGTNDKQDNDLFNKGKDGMNGGSYGNAAIHLGGVASVGSCKTCTTLNYGVTGVSTLGLEDTLVSGTWINHTLDDALWIDTLNLSFHPLDGLTNTTLVIGRQELDTPLVFTEKWNIAQNTYDGAVAVNNDIVDTTLVGAWVGRSNIAGGDTVKSDGGYNSSGFDKFLTDEGAYALGAITKVIPNVMAQAWYYIAPSTAKVAWLQADTEVLGFSLGAQYGMLDCDDNSNGNAYAVKLGYGFEGLSLSASYSDVEELSGTSKALGFVNLGGAQTPLYTAGWWDVGSQGMSDTTAMTFTAEYALEDIADVGAYYTTWESGDNTTNEITVTVGKDFDNLNLSLAYINTDADEASDAVNDLQIYATYKF